jgi:two-component system CheB/CheR fusion protein
MIYLRPEAQAKIIAVFNFALRPGGFLLLGAAETVAAPDRLFEQISKPARLYRKLRQAGPEPLPVGPRGADSLRLLPRPATPKPRPADIGEICRKLVLERYAPAALLVNARLEWLYAFGPTDAFLRVPSGPATHDLLAQLPASLRGRVRDAIAQAAAAPAASPVIRIEGGRITRDGNTRLFSIEIQPVPGDGDKFLVCFLNQPEPQPGLAAVPLSAAADGGARIAALEAELSITRAELQHAVHGLESAAEEHNAINEEALSVNEEYQSTNEELLTSKEELQSLNEELTALNSQLQETLERSRTTTMDLRNVLYSTDVPTLFLDEKLSIRFFTPSAALLFPIIAGDVGRQLADFRSRADDPALLSDAARVLATGGPWECEIATVADTWYLRRILPYRTFDGAIAGVVITFNDITQRKAAAAAVETAHQDSERANLAKSRFLAAASHDLRQPLQSMALIAGMLAKSATDTTSQKLVGRLDHMVQSINTMLNAMLDINQIEAGIVQPAIASVQAADLLTRLKEKFADQAAAQNTDLRVVPCSLHIATDPALLEQMLSNLLGNALKYTKSGRVLIGCRRQGESLRFEVWDSGIGIAADQLKAIFDEYHQIGNTARERSRGLGLGLSIVQRLGLLLRHKITVRSKPGRGSVFAVEIPRAPAPAAASPSPGPRPIVVPPGSTILLIEDDADISQLLETFLGQEGFRVAVAPDAASARALVAGGAIIGAVPGFAAQPQMPLLPAGSALRPQGAEDVLSTAGGTIIEAGLIPDLILADYNLPGDEDGLHVAQALRASLGAAVPIIIVTGDISTATLRLIAAQNCMQMNKPMKLANLLEAISTLLGPLPDRQDSAPASRLIAGQERTIYIVDDDPQICNSMRDIFESVGKRVETFQDAESFLGALPRRTEDCCLLIDAALPGMSGLDLLRRLAADSVALPAIMITGLGDIATAVEAMKAGAADFMEKPVQAAELLTCVRRVLDERHSHQGVEMQSREAAELMASLTERQREVMERVLQGQPSKNIAADLGISQRTVENHRAAVMEKTGAGSIPALARLAVLAARPAAARGSTPDRA